MEETGNSCIQVDAIDNIISKTERVSFINLGISTAEKEILDGAQDTIKRNHPKLLVFMGSAKEELFLLPKTIKEMDSSYKIYIRFIQAMPSRIFMYAI